MNFRSPDERRSTWAKHTTIKSIFPSYVGDSQVTDVTNHITVILYCCCIWGQHLAWRSPPNSQSKIKNLSGGLAWAFHFSVRCQRIQIKPLLPKARPTGNTQLWLARMAFIPRTMLGMDSTPGLYVKWIMGSAVLGQINIHRVILSCVSYSTWCEGPLFSCHSYTNK